MPGKVLKSGQAIARRRNLWPLDVLFDRLEACIAAEEWGHAERLAETLAPYCHRRMAAEPAPETKEALKAGRLVISQSAE